MASLPRPTIGLALLGLSGCLSSTPWEDPAPAAASEDLIQAPLVTTWEALPRVYRFLGLEPIDEVDREAHAITVVQRMQVRNGLVGSREEPLARCSAETTIRRTDSGGNVAFRRIDGIATIRIRSAVSETARGILLRSELVASATMPAAPPAAPVSALCFTTGRLEGQIVEGVRAVLSSSDSDPLESPDRQDARGRRPF